MSNLRRILSRARRMLNDPKQRDSFIFGVNIGWDVAHYLFSRNRRFNEAYGYTAEELKAGGIKGDDNLEYYWNNSGEAFIISVIRAEEKRKSMVPGAVCTVNDSNNTTVVVLKRKRKKIVTFNTVNGDTKEYNPDMLKNTGEVLNLNGILGRAISSTNFGRKDNSKT